MSPAAGDAKATRPWRLRGYSATDKKQLVSESTCRGDKDLDTAMRRLEQDPKIGRLTAEQAW